MWAGMGGGAAAEPKFPSRTPPLKRPIPHLAGVDGMLLFLRVLRSKPGRDSRDTRPRQLARLPERPAQRVLTT